MIELSKIKTPLTEGGVETISATFSTSDLRGLFKALNQPDIFHGKVGRTEWWQNVTRAINKADSGGKTCKVVLEWFDFKGLYDFVADPARRDESWRAGVQKSLDDGFNRR